MFGQGVLEMPDRQFENLLCRDDCHWSRLGRHHVKYTMLDAIEKDNLPRQDSHLHRCQASGAGQQRKISGVIAQDPGGEIHIHCKAVMLACGGFGRNDEMLKEYCEFDFFGGETPSIGSPCPAIPATA